MNRRQRVAQIRHTLGPRKLVWFGTRGADGAALLILSEFTEGFSIIAPLGRSELEVEICLESVKGRRVDLESYNLGQDHSQEAKELRRCLSASLTEPAVVVAYRSTGFFTSIYFPRSDVVEYLGLFHERQAAFEHKPWAESQLRKAAVRVVPWRYFGEEDREHLVEMLGARPLVLRASRSDSGSGLKLIRTAEELLRYEISPSDGFVAAAPLMEPNIPLNVGACVFRDGSVSLHTPSVQLIGLHGYTNRRFGYCGNDFSRIRDLDTEILNQLEDIGLKVGKWLASMGYVGAFGIDAIVYDGLVYLTEINPRFQGSSALSAEIDAEMDRPDVFLEHMAAFLGLQPPASVPLNVLATEQRRVAQVVCHNCESSSAVLRSSHRSGEHEILCVLWPDPSIIIEPEAILFRAVIGDSVTEDGLSISPRYDRAMREIIVDHFVPAGSSTESARLPPGA